MTMHFYRSIMISIMFLIHSRIHLRLVAIGTTSIFIWYVSSEHDSCTFTLMCISIVYFFVNQIDENNCLHINYERIMHRQISSSSKFSVTILDISTRFNTISTLVWNIPNIINHWDVIEWMFNCTTKMDNRSFQNYGENELNNLLWWSRFIFLQRWSNDPLRHDSFSESVVMTSRIEIEIVRYYENANVCFTRSFQF